MSCAFAVPFIPAKGLELSEDAPKVKEFDVGGWNWNELFDPGAP